MQAKRPKLACGMCADQEEQQLCQQKIQRGHPLFTLHGLATRLWITKPSGVVLFQKGTQQLVRQGQLMRKLGGIPELLHTPLQMLHQVLLADQTQLHTS